MDERCRIKEKFDEMVDSMCGFTPDTLAAINSQAPDFIETIHSLDRVANVDGAIDRKHKRLMALSCVCVRMCEDCIYSQAKVCKNFGASRAEILEALKVAVMTGGVPCWSIAKEPIAKLFAEWDEEERPRRSQTLRRQQTRGRGKQPISPGATLTFPDARCRTPSSASARCRCPITLWPPVPT